MSHPEGRLQSACTIPTLLYAAARRYAASPALLEERKKSTSYESLYSFVCGCRSALIAAGVRPGQRLALAISGGADALSLNLVGMATGIALPMNPTLPLDAVLAQLRLVQADVVIGDPYAAPNYKVAASQLGLPFVGIRLDARLPAGQFVVGHGEHQTPANGHSVSPPFLPFSTAAVLQTSGSTGEPKRVPLTHGNLLASAEHIEQSMNLTAGDRFLNVTPHFRVVGIALVLAALRAGNAIYCTPGFLRGQFLGWATEFQPTWFWAAPAMLKDLLPLVQAAGKQACGGALRMIRTGSASLSAEWLEPLEESFGVPVVENYGMTEAAPQIACNPVDRRLRRAGSAGKAAGPDVLILTANNQPALTGEEGEIVIRGANVMAGYEGDHSEAPFWTGLGGRWFRTGDIGRLDADGYLYLSGRQKEMINRGGEKVWPREVEEALERHSAVQQAAVFPVPHPILGEEVGAAIVLRPGEELTEPQLQRFASCALAAYQMPTRVAFVPAIHAGPGGKIQRGRLAAELGMQPFADTCPSTVEFAEPTTPLHNELREIWRSILRIPTIGIDDDFFAIGGDSLAITTLLAALQDRYGVMRRLLDRIDFFDHPTIRAQATVIERNRTEAASHAGPGEAGPSQRELPSNLSALNQPIQRSSQRRGDTPPLFLAPMAGCDPSYLYHFARHLVGDQRCIGMNISEIPQDATVESLADTFIASIVKVCPDGPLYLGGHCFGGVLAYEIACKLSAMGRAPEVLYLFDVPRPDYPHPWKNRGLFARAILHHATEPSRYRVYGAAAARHLKKLNGRRLEALGVAAASDPTIRAMRLYESKTYNGPAIVFVARDHVQTGSPLDRRLGWLSCVTPSPEVVYVDSDHVNFFDTANAAELAAVCRQRLPKRAFESVVTVTGPVTNLESAPSPRVGVPA